jgi:hypothetical protein
MKEERTFGTSSSLRRSTRAVSNSVQIHFPHSSSPIIKQKYSLDTVNRQGITTNTPSSTLLLRKRRSRKALRTRQSKLDTLDNTNLTSFPMEPPRSVSINDLDKGFKDKLSLSIIEDYIPPSPPRPLPPSHNLTLRSKISLHDFRRDLESNQSTIMKGCDECSEMLYVDKGLLSRSNVEFLCPSCASRNNSRMNGGLPLASISSPNLVRTDIEDNPYYIHHKGPEWYAGILRTFRWRWRIRGLI